VCTACGGRCRQLVQVLMTGTAAAAAAAALTVVVVVLLLATRQPLPLRLQQLAALLLLLLLHGGGVLVCCRHGYTGYWQCHVTQEMTQCSMVGWSRSSGHNGGQQLLQCRNPEGDHDLTCLEVQQTLMV
jgi:hypothetical protein